MADGRSPETASQDKSSRRLSLLEVPPSFFDDARVVYNEVDGACSPTEGFPRSSSSEASSSQADIGFQGSLNRWACNTCSNLEFSCLDEQRLHFKSDFHRFNVKRKLMGKDAISEEGFELLAKGQHQKESDGDDDNVSSISGSGEEDSDSSNGEEPLHARSSSMSKSQSYISVMLPLSGEIAIFWKCLLSRDNERLVKQEDKSGIGGKDFVSEEALLQRLKKFVSRDGSEENNLWTILLLRGGHFAGCVFDCRKGSILAHKTYHRYVVRAKAGGKQSTKDGTGRAPKSAGASLRRHNEASLHREIRDLLASWKGYLEAASCIYVHAPSKNSYVMFGGEDAPLARNDERVRNVPFTTRRPTFKEAKRTFNELVTISIHSLKLTRVADSSARIPESGRHQALGQLDGNFVTTDQIKELRGDAEPDNFPDGKEDKELISSTHASANGNSENFSPLHDAARLGQMDLVLELLEKGANPCARDHRGQTPYNLASDKETRNVFRRFMAANMEMWDWHSANVPSPLTDEMESAQAAKQAEKDAKRKAKSKEQKKMRKEKLKARDMAAAASLEKIIPEKSSNLNSDAKQLEALNEKRAAEAIEREKRALAAERRMKALSLGSASGNSNSQDGPYCSHCGESLAGKTPFYRLSFQYCTTACVRLHRQALD